MGRLEQEEDQRTRRELFDRVMALLEEHEKTDSTLQNFDKQPDAFSLSRHRHLLTYQEGPPTVMGSGEIRWRKQTDGNQDPPFRFRVTRSALKADRFLFNDSAPLTLEETAALIVSTFLNQTAR